MPAGRIAFGSLVTTREGWRRELLADLVLSAQPLESPGISHDNMVMTTATGLECTLNLSLEISIISMALRSGPTLLDGFRDRDKWKSTVDLEGATSDCTHATRRNSFLRIAGSTPFASNSRAAWCRDQARSTGTSG